MKNVIFFLLIFLSCVSFAQKPGEVKIETVTLDLLRPARYARSFQGMDGDVYVMGLFRISVQDDGELVSRVLVDPVFSPVDFNESRMNTFYSRPGLFIALQNRLLHEKDSVYTLKMWRSDDSLKTLAEEQAKFILPEAGHVYFGKGDEWAGLFCHRSILELNDGSLIAALYGNFETDTITPTNDQSKLETRYKLRAFIARSMDDGTTWHYSSSLAVPDIHHPDQSEGYNEWSMVQLNDGRIFAVIRTGHFTPLVMCFSSDQGQSWSKPEVCTEFGPAGCDPCLLKLSDGRIALSYGEMVQPPSNAAGYFENFIENGDHRRRCRLAISTSPDVKRWEVIDVTGFDNRSAYSSIFEMKPGLLLYQTDLELFAIHIPR